MPRASTAWTIPEIRVVKDDQGRLRIDQGDPATYGAYAARQFLATAAADPRFKEGMTKRPSAPSIKITYLAGSGEIQQLGVRELFCRVEGDDLVLSQFEDAEGNKRTDLPIASPPSDESEPDVDDEDRLHDLFMAELDDTPAPSAPVEVEPEPEPGRPDPPRVRRLPSGPLRQYEEATDATPAAAPQAASPAPEPTPRGPSVAPSSAKPPGPAKPPGATPGVDVGLTVRALNEGEAAALRALIEAKAGQTRWASGILIQAAERFPGDRKAQNEHLANLLRVSLDPSRAESRTPLGGAMRSIIEEVHAHKASVLDRDPLKAEKVTLRPFARAALETTPVDDGPMKTVSGAARRTPAQVLAKLEDPKLARATRVKLLLEVVPELIDAWRPDKESTRSEAGNENSPAIVRRMFAVANEQRQQRKFIDDGMTFRKAGERYAVLETKLPKPSITDD